MNVNTTVEQLVRDDIHEFPESLKARVRGLVERAFAAGSNESTDATFAETIQRTPPMVDASGLAPTVVTAPSPVAADSTRQPTIRPPKSPR